MPTGSDPPPPSVACEAPPRTSLEIKVGPPQLAVHQGYTLLVCEPDGQIKSPSTSGLYFRDTRVISDWALCANGQPWDLLNSGTTTAFTVRFYLTNRSIVTEDGSIGARTLGLVLSRCVDNGMHEDIDVTNYGARRVRFNLEIALRCDFADIFEVKSGRIVRRGRVITHWSVRQQRLATSYRNRKFRRKVTVTARDGDSQALHANGWISFEVAIDRGARWHVCLDYDLSDGKRWWRAPDECAKGRKISNATKRLAAWKNEILKVETSNEQFQRLVNQAIDDLAALRLSSGEKEDGQFIPAAGLPWFIAMFGRDSLIASLQSIFIHSGFARATLNVLGAWQATAHDNYRDAQPGKIPHELRLGELAALKLIPHTPYYGTADATPLYLVLLHATWRLTGDRELLSHHLNTAERCLEWIDQHGDFDGDGFQEYVTRSRDGLANQGWKDSGDALVYPEGSLVKPPIAVCEVQGYVYDAWLRMAEIHDVLGNAERAAQLRNKAVALFKHFNESFWDDAAGFYAFALDGEKKKVMSIASNPGHCLWSGIVPPDRAKRVVSRLMQPDMCSGWGIRTLSSQHPAFNPYSYQVGSIWPHDNGFLALGLRRYGYVEEAARIARDVVRAGSFFMLNRLPELYAGIQREAINFPVQYLGANVPQAWAAGSVFFFLQSVLGLQPDASNATLYVDPVLPVWLPDIHLRDLRMGKQSFDIRFWRSGEETRFDVTKGSSDCVARKDMKLWGGMAAERATPVPSRR